MSDAQADVLINAIYAVTISIWASLFLDCLSRIRKALDKIANP